VGGEGGKHYLLRKPWASYELAMIPRSLKLDLERGMA
jgi:hypothetical protein